MNIESIITELRQATNAAILSDRTFSEVTAAAMHMYDQCDEQTVTAFLVQVFNTMAGQLRHDVSEEIQRAKEINNNTTQKDF